MPPSTRPRPAITQDVSQRSALVQCAAEQSLRAIGTDPATRTIAKRQRLTQWVAERCAGFTICKAASGSNATSQ